MLQRNNLEVALAETSGGQRSQKESVRIGSSSHGNSFAPEIFDSRYAGLRTCDQRRPFRRRVDVNCFDRVAIGPSDERRCSRRRTEIDTLSPQKLQRFVATEALDQFYLDAARPQIVL